MKAQVKATTRKVKHVDRFGQPGERLQPVVELWLDGVCYSHDCESAEQARQIAMSVTRSLGLSK